MIYILMIWTAVAGAGTNTSTHYKYDWRPLGEFHMEEDRMNKMSAREMCERAARELVLKPDAYRCVRSK